MGSKGIRRRKTYRRLPAAAHMPTENELIPPNIMWPDAGSGFEANQYSPAGTAQRQWRQMQRIGRSGEVSAPARLAIWALVGLPVSSGLVVLIYRLVTGS